MIGTVVKAIKENYLIHENSNIIVGFSGGSDSVCLVDILYRIKNERLLEFDFNIIVVHINHMLRGENSNKDKEFVINFCLERNLQIFTYDEDIKKLKSLKKQSIEEVAREVRKQRFEKLLDGENDKIALAHNYSDNAETLLMHLFRGSGLNGLLGMGFIEKKYIRPLIKTSKEDILKYIKDNSLEYRTDESNFEEIYQRNKVRLSLIPYLEKNFNSNIITSLNNTIDILKVDNSFLNLNADKVFNEIHSIKNYKGTELLLLDIVELQKLHEAILTRVFIKAYERINGSNVDINFKNLEDLKNLIYKENGKKIVLSKKNVAFRGYKVIYFYREMKIIQNSFNYLVKNEELTEVIENLYIYIGEKENFNGYKKVKELELFFEEEQEFYIRSRVNSDKIYSKGINGHMTLKNYFSKARIDELFRDDIPLLATKSNLIMILDKNLISTDNFNSGHFRYIIQVYKPEVSYE